MQGGLLGTSGPHGNMSKGAEGMQPARLPHTFVGVVQGGLLGMVPFDPMGQISDKNRQSEVRNGRCASA